MFVLSTFKDDVNSFLKSGAFYIALGFALLIVIIVILFSIYNRKKRK